MSTDVHTLSGAYALNAVKGEEAAEFRRHLESCQVCRDEVREFRGAVARMGAAEAVQLPPPELRQRVLAAAARTPQLPPPASDVRPPARADQGAGDRAGARAATAPARRRRSGARWLAAAAAAVVVAGGVGLGVRALDDGAAPLTPAAERVFEASDARTVSVKTANGGTLTVGVSPGRNEMAVDTRKLPDPGDGRVYQIWAVHGEEMVSAAVLTDPDAGAAMGMPEEDTEVAITVEPRGGSDQPTGEPIIQVDPRAV